MDQASEEAGPRSEATDINNAGGWHTQYTHTHDWTIFIYKKKTIQNLVQYGQNPFR